MSLDARIHDFYDDLVNLIFWRDFKDVGIDEPYYDYYYAEDELYLIRNRITEQVFFTEARSPKQALEHFKDALHITCCGEGSEDETADSD